LPFEPVQSRVERAVFDLKSIFGRSANRLANPVPMLGALLQGPQDEHVERPLHQLYTIFVGFLFRHL
jgi:hypothetical protein